MNDFKMLNKAGKIRVIIFTLLMILLVYFAVGYSAELSQILRYAGTIDKIGSAVEKIEFDGADFSWFFIPAAKTATSLVSVLSAVAYEAVTIIVSLLCLGIFRVTAFRKTAEIRQEEYWLGKKIQKILMIGSIAVSAILTISSWGLMGIALNLPLLLFSWLFYILPVKNRISNDQIN